MKIVIVFASLFWRFENTSRIIGTGVWNIIKKALKIRTRKIDIIRWIENTALKAGRRKIVWQKSYGCIQLFLKIFLILLQDKGIIIISAE